MSSQAGDAAITRLQDIIADGRLANAFYRQQQLRKIQKALIERKDTLIEALVKDSPVTRNEAFTELYSTISAAKSYFDQTSPTKDLETEYAVARNQDAPLARRGVGIVVIKPQCHTPLFSTISPLCAALASGNAVLLVVS
jgi:acyl-CoA reductase-like NAD-dependent aldehyde dehydrogenase